MISYAIRLIFVYLSVWFSPKQVHLIDISTLAIGWLRKRNLNDTLAMCDHFS